MFEIRNGNIYVNRGDSFVLDIPVTDENGGDYTLDALEKLRFSVSDIDFYRTLSEIHSEDGSTRIEVSGEETKRWKGRLEFNIKLIYPDGSGETIIGRTPTHIPRIYVMEVSV